MARNFSRFETCFPLYHRDRYAAEALAPTRARFSSGGSARDRQVSAYQKGIRPREGPFAAHRPATVPQTPQIVALFQEVMDTAKATNALGFDYTVSPGLWNALLGDGTVRIRLACRRPLTLSMGSYSLDDFNKFYVALLAVCGAHDHLCFSWGMGLGTYPLESAVLVRSVEHWVDTLSSLSRVDKTKCSTIIDDLTFKFDRSVELRIHPFVPVGRATLAVAPPFPLSSRHDENILRVVSQERREQFDITSTTKEEETLAALQTLAGGRHSLQGPVALPDPVPDIDLLIVDEDAAALTIVELKWMRKIVRTREIPGQDAEVRKGFKQLNEIRRFLSGHPGHLAAIGRIARSVTDYARVTYMVVARDHWVWVDSSDGIAIVEYDAFVASLGRYDHVHQVVDELLNYEWLPIEGRDFEVRYDPTSVNGVTIESEVFYEIPE